MSVGLSGLASGFDWHSLIDQLISVDRAPETRMRSDQSNLQQQNSAYGNIKTQLLTLQTSVKTLNDPTFFDSRLAQTSDSSLGTAKADPGAPVGSYVFDFTQLATAARWRGSANVGKSLSTTNNVSGVILSSAGFNATVTAGNFSINGKQVTVATSDSLQAVFDKISAATGGAVEASYSSSTDEITLTSSDEIVLGSTTDTSNFLQVAKLYNNGAGSVTSSAALGGVKLTGNMSTANLSTAISNGGTGAGEFKVNGVSINFDASTDSIQNVLDRINSSSAGVTATFDTINDRFMLVNKATGDTGVGVEDVKGNFLTATGLRSGTLERGKNLLYTVNGGPQLTSQSNTIADTSSGLTGLSVTALKKDSVTITVSSDSAKIKTGLNDFLTAYNNVQSLIDTQTASSTDAKGKVTAAVLANDNLASEIAVKLRSTSFRPGALTTSAVRSLADLGIDSNGNDNKLTLTDETKLDSALANNLGAIKDLFSSQTDGIAGKLNTYLDSTAGDGGTLASKQDSLTKQSVSIDTQIADLERRLKDEQDRLTASFVAMETAQAKTNQQLQFLQQRFGSGSG